MFSINVGYGYKIRILRKILIRFNKFLLDFSAIRYFACSQKAGYWLFGKEKNFDIIHNAIEVDKYKYNLIKRQKERKKLNLENNFVIEHVGRFVYQKNHEFLIDIFNEIHKTLLEFVLVLIDDIVEDKLYLNEVKQIVKKLNLEKM